MQPTPLFQDNKKIPRGGSFNRAKKLARTNNVSIIIFSLPTHRADREKRVDYVGFLKVETPANAGQDINGAQLSDMIESKNTVRADS